MPKNKRTEFKKYSDQFVEFNFVIVKEDKEKQTSKAEVYLEGFKVKQPPVTTNMEKILLAIEGLTSKVNEMSFEMKEMKSDMIKMEERLKSDMIKMEKRFNDKIDNFKAEMNDRFDKLEFRVSTLESFHKEDLDKKSKIK